MNERLNNTSIKRPTRYRISLRNQRCRSNSTYFYDWFTVGFLQDFIANYPIVSIEDAFDQDDWSAWTALMKQTDIQLVGDDLTVTNPKRIQTAVDTKACNALLLKVRWRTVG